MWELAGIRSSLGIIFGDLTAPTAAGKKQSRSSKESVTRCMYVCVHIVRICERTWILQSSRREQRNVLARVYVLPWNRRSRNFEDIEIRSSVLRALPFSLSLSLSLLLSMGLDVLGRALCLGKKLLRNERRKRDTSAVDIGYYYRTGRRKVRRMQREGTNEETKWR